MSKAKRVARSAMSALDDTTGGTLVKQKAMLAVDQVMPAEVEYVPPPNMEAGVTNVDTVRCIVSAILCTDVVDTYGDIVEPSGIKLEVHRSNPVVLWNHGNGLASGAGGHSLPVASAELADGTYTVQMAGNLLVGDARFSQSNQFAQQVFALYAEKMLRGFSVNVIPIYGKWDRLEDKKLPGGKAKACYRYTQSWLKEFSACPIPVNPEALTIAVQRGKVGGEEMNEILRSSLNSYCLPMSNNVSFGVTIERSDDHKATQMAISDETERKVDDEEGAKDNAESDKEKPSEEETAEEVKKSDDELKAGPRGMLDHMQAVRDYRLENARKHHATEDPDAMDAHEEIDGHLAKAEQVGRDYLLDKGHKENDLPKMADFEAIKSMCKGDEGASAMVERSYAYTPPRIKFGTRDEAAIVIPQQEIREAAKRARRLARMAS